MPRAPKKPADARALHRKAERHNWDDGTRALYAVLEDPACDLGTGLLVYWRAMPHWYRQFASLDLVPDHAREVGGLLWWLEPRLVEGRFATNAIPFDPRSDRGTDRTRCSPDDEAAAVRPIPPALMRANLDAPPAAPPLEERLHAASRQGDLAALTALLRDPAWAALPAAARTLVLCGAAQQGQTAAIEALVAAGAKVSGRWERLTPLEHAAYSGHLESVQALVRLGAKASSARLWWAVFGNAETIRWLVEAGAPLEGRNEHGETALFWAATRARPDTLRALLALGADSSVRRTKDGLSVREKTQQERDQEAGLLTAVIRQGGGGGEAVREKITRYDEVLALLGDPSKPPAQSSIPQ